MNFIKQNIIAIIVVGVIVVFLYYTISSSRTPSSALLTSTTSSGSPVSQQLLSSLTSLHTIVLNSAIFTDPAFVSLTDFGVVIPPENVGRRNPFAPFGSTIVPTVGTPVPVAKKKVR